MTRPNRLPGNPRRASDPSARTRHRATALLLLAPALLLSAAALSQSRFHERLLFATQLDSGPAPNPLSLLLLEQGTPREVTSVEPVDLGREPWQVVLFLDLPRSSEAGLEALSEALDSEAERLTKVAEVRVVVANTTVVQVAVTRDPEELRALVRNAATGERAGELLARRRDTEAAVNGLDRNQSEQRRRQLLDQYFAEESLREWQRNATEDFVLGQLASPLGRRLPARTGSGDLADPPLSLDPERPRALFLVRDGLDASAADFVRRFAQADREPKKSTKVAPIDSATEKKPDNENLDPLLERRLREPETGAERSFARTLAALGWQAFPLRLGAPSKLLSERNPDGELAEATGGMVVTNGEELGAAIDAMERVLAIRYRTPNVDGAPAPLDLRAESPIATVASSTLLAAPKWSTGVAPDRMATVYARRLLEDQVSGELTVEAALVGDLAGSATLEAAVDLGELKSEPSGTAAPLAHSRVSEVPLTSDQLRITIVSSRLDREPEVQRLQGSGLELIGERWILRSPVTTPDDLQSLVVVAEDLRTGAWGAAVAIESDESLASGDPAATVETAAVRPPEVDGRLSPPATVADSEGAREERLRALIGEPKPRVGGNQDRGAAMMRIVPPRERELAGRQRFDILLSNDAIRSVEFYLDGAKVAEDTRNPFEASIDLGPEPVEHSIRAVGLSRTGLVLGEDSLTVNAPRTRLGIAFTRIDAVPGSQDVEATADLTLPPDAELDRVELYRNEKLAATLTKPPFSARLPGPARLDADFLRVVAYFRDGTSIEDVHLLGEKLSDRIEVNLVEIYAVVTDRDGHPLRGLEAKDFEVRLARNEIEIDRFAIAEQVPLVLGLTVDTSSSMWSLMPDTRKAAARFLGDTVSSIDKAFVVDFDDRPRLVHPITGKVFDLIESLSRLQASGATALYDSILFSLLQFEPGLGRKAIVLLTDGDDYNSHFGFGRVQKTAAEAGVPIYFIALGGFDGERPSFRKEDLEVIAEDSGGRVFYVHSMDEVVDAYRQIGDELRSQYLLAFATDSPLTDQEISKLEVKVKDKGYEVRTVVGRDR